MPDDDLRFAACLEEVLWHEGGYADNPRDPGGATNLGITIATLGEWRGRAVTKADVKALTREEAAAIYRARYWKRVRGDALPAGLDLAVFDFAVNSGPARAVKALQRELGVAQDGLVGPVTLGALGSHDFVRLAGSASSRSSRPSSPSAAAGRAASMPCANPRSRWREPIPRPVPQPLIHGDRQWIFFRVIAPTSLRG
jgi:hypothetical protein